MRDYLSNLKDDLNEMSDIQPTISVSRKDLESLIEAHESLQLKLSETKTKLTGHDHVMQHVIKQMVKTLQEINSLEQEGLIEVKKKYIAIKKNRYNAYYDLLVTFGYSYEEIRELQLVQYDTSMEGGK